MEKRKALGKGLQALIPDIKANIEAAMSSKADAEKAESVVYLDISEIKPGRYQPRSDFNHEKMQELASSIKEKGVVQPVLARKTESGYELIAGERRLRAVKSLGIKKIPAIVKEADDIDAMELGLIENIQREDLNPIEEAKAYQRLNKEFGFSHEEIAQAVGKDRTAVTNTLRLLNLPMKIQQFVLDDVLTMGHARALLSVSDPHRQMKICQKIIRRGLSVREAEQLVRPYIPPERRTSVYKMVDPHIKAAEEELQQKLGTKVKIHHGKKRGRVIIEYFSTDDLERIIDIIKR